MTTKTAQTTRLVLFGHLIVSFFCVLLILTVMFRYPLFKGWLGVLGRDRTNDASGVILAFSSFFFLLSCFINTNCFI